ncbi:MAG: class I SAM-dependent methyltransferase [Myxococcota bacterium]|nr:class I SAM-dependent methyltransferase [Myxococcota bacterium]
MSDATETYYDRFAERYDRRRGGGYHAWLDDRQAALVRRHARGGRLLEVGCGTGLVLERLKHDFDDVVGIDLSEGMLERARARGLCVQQARAEALPFEDESFDMICSFKVLAHVQEMRNAAMEMVRVLKPGGVIVAEFYNPRSIRGFLWMVKPPGVTGAGGQHEKDVYFRFDSPRQARGYFPDDLETLDTYGLRVLTPLPFLHKIPLVAPALQGMEHLAGRGLPFLGSFYDLVLRKPA